MINLSQIGHEKGLKIKQLTHYEITEYLKIIFTVLIKMLNIIISQIKWVKFPEKKLER